MKILMLTPYLPYPPSSGGQIRSYNLIKNLAKKHQITLFSLIKDEKEKEHVAELEKYCHKVRIFRRPSKPWSLKNILKTGFSLYPFLVVRNMSLEEKVGVAEELDKEKYDLIHAETFYVMPHIPQTEVPILLVDQTIEFQVYQHFVESVKNLILKPFLYLDVFKIRYWELKFWQKANKVIAVSEADKEKMLSLVKNLNVGVVPNGAGEDLIGVWGKKEPPKNPIIFFQANFFWLQNVEAARNLKENVFPLIKEKIKEAECWISGQVARQKIGDLEQNGVKIIDLKDTDIDGVIDGFKKASVFVAPLEGPGGTRLKILAAMAAGVPVVTTKVGIEGIDAKDGEEVLIANNWPEMAKKTILLLKDKNLYRRLIESARILVEEKYNYLKIAQVLDRYYQEVSGGKN